MISVSLPNWIPTTEVDFNASVVVSASQDSRAWETEAGGSENFKPAWSTEHASGYLELWDPVTKKKKILRFNKYT